MHLSAALVARRRLIALCALGGATLAAALSLVMTPEYQAAARFAPEEPTQAGGAGGLASLASQLGARGIGGSRSLQFYAEVLTGRDLLQAVALDSFPDPHDPTRKRPLIDILEIEGSSPERRIVDAVNYLVKHAITTNVNDRTGMVTLAVTLPYPGLAADVANRLYQRLERFNYASRRTAASERRRFAEREIAAARAELTAEEDRLAAFLEANRAGLTTPRLLFQRDRMQRRINILQEVNSTLARELQEAKVAEVRDTPLFTLVQAAVPPLDRAAPHRTRLTLLGGLVGGALAILWVWLGITGYLAGEMDPDAYAAWRQALLGREEQPG